MKYIIFTLLVLFFAACSPSKEKLQEEIAIAEKELFSNDKGTFVFEEKLVLKAIDAYQKFVNSFPEDSMAAEYLFKKADLHRSLKNTEQAITTYNLIIEKYPNYIKTPYCLFLKGFIYENELNNLEKAKESYQAFLDTYPNHDLADDVAFSLNNLGKTPEQLIKEFEEMQQKILSDSLQNTVI
jgi:tetratricopeptide (TPR) repeat protein